MNQTQVIDRYFMEHRAKLIDIAAFLDRLDRSDSHSKKEDFRITAFRQALCILQDSRPGRARRVLEHFSDPSSEPIQSAAGMKGAHGAYMPDE